MSRHPEGISTPEPVKSTDYKIQSIYIAREEGVPDDVETLNALREWADAWGTYVWQCKIENQPEPPNEDEASTDLKTMGDILETKGATLEKLLPEPKFFSGVVMWKGGKVELTTERGGHEGTRSIPWQKKRRSTPITRPQRDVNMAQRVRKSDIWKSKSKRPIEEFSSLLWGTYSSKAVRAWADLNNLDAAQSREVIISSAGGILINAGLKSLKELCGLFDISFDEIRNLPQLQQTVQTDLIPRILKNEFQTQEVERFAGDTEAIVQYAIELSEEFSVPEQAFMRALIDAIRIKFGSLKASLKEVSKSGAYQSFVYQMDSLLCGLDPQVKEELLESAEVKNYARAFFRYQLANHGNKPNIDVRPTEDFLRLFRVPLEEQQDIVKEFINKCLNEHKGTNAINLRNAYNIDMEIPDNIMMSGGPLRDADDFSNQLSISIKALDPIFSKITD